MKKYFLICIMMTTILLSGCSILKKAVEPTALPTETPTPLPTSTPAYTPTPEYCPLSGFVEFDQLVTRFTEQGSKAASASDFGPIMTEMMTIYEDLKGLDLPDCLTLAADYLSKALFANITAFGLMDIAGGQSMAQDKLVEATTYLKLFTEEYSRLLLCRPDCQP